MTESNKVVRLEVGEDAPDLRLLINMGILLISIICEESR